MEVPSDHDMRLASPGGSLSKKEGKFTSPRHLKSLCHVNTNAKVPTSPSNHKMKMTNGSARGNASMSFSTNNNSVVCLPLVSEGLKLVWTQSDQTKELDSIPELVQAFNVFPYPTSQEVSTLANICALPLDKVKVWFMVQRIKYGISWASEDIEETRCKLAGPDQASDFVHEESKKRKKSERDDQEFEENDHIEDSVHPVSHKKHKNESLEFKRSPSTDSPSPHSPSQNSDYYSHPVDGPSIPSAASPSSLKSSFGSQQKHKRYKKSKAQLTALRKSFLQENWPAETELRRLQEETGLSRNEIRKWFSDSRYQLRNGRGMPGLMSPAAEEEKNESHFHSLSESEQLQPLSLVIEKQHTSIPAKGGNRSKKSQKRGSSNSQFFQIFLSNTLEAFGEGDIDESETKPGCEDGYKDDDKPNNNNADLGGEEERETCESLSLQEPSVSVSSTLCLTPSHVSMPSSQKVISRSSKKSARTAKANTAVSSPSQSSSLLTAAGRVRKTKEQLDILKEYFLRCPWPKSEEYTQLVELTLLPRADVIQWFGDTRYAVKNGHLRWVRGTVRDQILAEIAVQQNGGSGADTSSSTGTPKNDGSRKRKSQLTSASNVPKSVSDSLDMHPLELYHQQTGVLQEKDLDVLCRKSKMSYQQVRDWFALKDRETVKQQNCSED